MCLFGCPSIPMDKATLERRRQQYQAHCTPQQDGNGRQCPIDDCAAPPPIACVDGHCAAAAPTTTGTSPGSATES